LAKYKFCEINEMLVDLIKSEGFYLHGVSLKFEPYIAVIE